MPDEIKPVVFSDSRVDAPKKKDPAPAVAQATEKLTVEAWAERKGMMPKYIEQPKRAGEFLPRRARVNPEHWKFAATKARSRWTEGFECTEADFDAAVNGALNAQYR